MTQNIEDLSVLARRAELPSLEQAELEALLDAQPEEHFWHLAACAVDTEEAEAADDSAAIARVLARLAQEAPRSEVVVLRRRFPVWLAAAAAALVVAATAAAVVSVQRARERSASQSARASATQSGTVRQVPRAALTNAVPSSDTRAPLLAPVAEAPSALVPTPSSNASVAPSAPAVPRSAAQLLSDAGRARREGFANQAATLLESLQARYPNAPEAVTADITLGSLKLQSGATRVALQHFDRYLQRAPGGSLAPEAMWGRSQALSRMGNGAAAHQTLLDLVRRYPASPYASSANAKLRALEHAP